MKVIASAPQCAVTAQAPLRGAKSGPGFGLCLTRSRRARPPFRASASMKRGAAPRSGGAEVEGRGQCCASSAYSMSSSTKVSTCSETKAIGETSTPLFDLWRPGGSLLRWTGRSISSDRRAIGSTCGSPNRRQHRRTGGDALLDLPLIGSPRLITLCGRPCAEKRRRGLRQANPPSRQVSEDRVRHGLCELTRRLGKQQIVALLGSCAPRRAQALE